MDDIGERGDEAREEYATIETRSVARKTEIHEGQDGEAADGIAVEVLRPRIVEAVEAELKKGWRRPDEHSREDRGVTSECFPFFFRHILASACKPSIDS